MTRVETRGLTIAYERSGPVVRGVSLSVEPGQLMAVLGPSGCGKTTLLRTIAGLLAPLQGDVLFDGVPVTKVPAEQRGVGLVFQKPLLFPHLSVGENVEFGLRMRGVDAAERKRLASEALEQVQLQEFGGRRVHELSGGQEQRVALARALVLQPKVLLLDEPFSALDEALRLQMREVVRDLQHARGITTIFVTHDQEEAADLAGVISVMLGGEVVQCGPVRALYEHPATVEVARFFGWQPWDQRRWCRRESVRIGGGADSVARREFQVVAIRDAGPHFVVTLCDADGRVVRAQSVAALAEGSFVVAGVDPARVVEF